MKNEETVFVFLNSLGEEKFVGKLFFSTIRANEIYSFEFDDDFLKDTTFSLDPDLCFFRGRQFVPNGKKIFGCFSDCCPDRWGRTLLERKEMILSEKENRARKQLFEMDYLLGVQDSTRSGGFRFKKNRDDEKYIGEDSYLSVPPIASLRKLQQACYNFESEKDVFETKWLSQILEPGSSLGGARPKATVQDVDGSFWVAKFPSRNDTTNNCAWEKTVNDLAAMCGLDVAESKFEKFGRHCCFLSKRFDRVVKNGKIQRIHFSSAMTQLGKTDGDSGEASYLDIANFLRTSGSEPENDLLELWNRIVFNIAISNTDDHLRNHGFLFAENGWKLSPLYDITPNVGKKHLSLNINEKNNRKSFELAMESRKLYGISESRAKENIEKITSTVKNNWKRIASQYGISRPEMDSMKSCFGGTT